MHQPFFITVSDRDKRAEFTIECPGPVEVGRSKGTEPPGLAADGGRLVIADKEERAVARELARVEPLADGRVCLTNISKNVTIAVRVGGPLAPGQSRELALPVDFTVGPKILRIQANHVEVTGLAEATIPPGRSARVPRFPTFTEAHRPADLVRWLQATQAVIHSAAGSDEFFAQAARAATDIVGLDSARVLLLRDGQWTPRPADPAASRPSQTVLARVRAERKPFYTTVREVGESPSIVPLQAVVAAPILSPAGDVIGALYGERRPGRVGAGPVTELEALLVELLAGAVAVGLARLEEERAAAEARVRFEQFFTRDLARHLTADPKLLDGHDADVTVLFADVRGYSRVAERLGAAETAKWMRDVLGKLSECVLAEGGVLIDYVGDELMALWGAPGKQPDHAGRATRAAQAMLRVIPALGGRWAEQVGEPLRIGVGVHSGPAWVGEVGTDHKFKYGPRGNTVNMASRVQGATKHLRVAGLMTGATRAGLDDTVPVRRLTAVRVVNISAPVELYEIIADPPPEWAGLRDGYEQALTAFEAGQAGDAARMLGNLLADHRDDGPSLILLKRAVEVLASGVAKYEPVWELPGK
jgi:adenylate cyclase